MSPDVVEPDGAPAIVVTVPLRERAVPWIVPPVSNVPAEAPVVLAFISDESVPVPVALLPATL